MVQWRRKMIGVCAAILWMLIWVESGLCLYRIYGIVNVVLLDVPYSFCFRIVLICFLKWY